MSLERRSFLKQAALTGAGAVVGAGAAGGVDDKDDTRAKAKTAAPSPLVVGLIGAGGMGMNHLGLLAARKDVRVAYVCDVDAERLAAAAKKVETISGRPPIAVADMRRLFDDRALDAVFIATPDHWHAPAAIMALDHGKHVYVEKPCCHNLREGALMIDAVKRTGKCLQVGTQTRSTAVMREAMERVLGGEIGDVLVAKAWNSQLRRSIGHTQPSAPPAHVDFPAWLGPTPDVPYRANLLPGVWRWWYDFGCGDIGNDGVHDIDVACWGLGVDGPPATVACLGGKRFFDDDQQFPDTQYVVCEYPASGGKTKQLIFEQRIWSPYVQEGYENGAAFYGTRGVLIIGHSVGWKLYGPRNKLIAEKTGSADLAAHHTNFFACIRGEQPQLAADIHAGYRAASVVHLANIAARVGRVVRFDAVAGRIVDDVEADRLVGRTYRQGHWAVPKGAAS